ncbi:hypothetical protein [Nocardia altamirensis]|uniref:hypothetical protein n=1 Tax=Nocardia altamirensis TaxID=472158 RepID=UPI00083FDD5C|nr:hypothetical protein [Nocardia altamirensis]
MSVTVPLELRVTRLEAKYMRLNEDRLVYEDAILETRDMVQQTHRAMLAVKSDLWWLSKETEAKFGELEEDVREIKLDMGAFKQEVHAEFATVKRDISGLKQDVSGLKQDVSGVKQDVSGLKQDFSGLKQDVSGLKCSIDAIVSHFGIVIAEGEH